MYYEDDTILRWITSALEVLSQHNINANELLFWLDTNMQQEIYPCYVSDFVSNGVTIQFENTPGAADEDALFIKLPIEYEDFTSFNMYNFLTLYTNERERAEKLLYQVILP